MEIVHKLEIAAGVEAVFAAVATQQGVNAWWAKKGTVAENIGGKSKLIFNKQGKLVEMGFETLDFVPNKRVEWLCTENANPAWHSTKITYELTPNENGCILNFSHSMFSSRWNNDEAFKMTQGGWLHFMKSLKLYCETGGGEPW